jgi:hypothetical protein
MHRINLFYLQKALDSITGKGRNATWWKNEILFVEAQIKKQAEQLMKAQFLGSHLVHDRRHTYLS